MENRYGMKWHKFLVNFSLWLTAISEILLGGVMLLMMTMDTPNRYRGENGLLIFAFVLLVLMVACGVYGIVVRFELARFKQNAPAHLLFVQIAESIVIALFMMIDEDVALTSIIPSIVWAFINRYYYSKRADLFVK